MNSNNQGSTKDSLAGYSNITVPTVSHCIDRCVFGGISVSPIKYIQQIHSQEKTVCIENYIEPLMWCSFINITLNLKHIIMDAAKRLTIANI